MSPDNPNSQQQTNQEITLECLVSQKLLPLSDKGKSGMVVELKEQTKEEAKEENLNQFRQLHKKKLLCIT